MPRVRRSKPQRERLLIREFIHHLKYRITRVEWQERPDALVTLIGSDGRRRVGIELTEHFSDTAAGNCSPLTPVDEFWHLVEASLVRRISHRKAILGIEGCIRFKPNLPLAQGKGKDKRNVVPARAIAAQIIDFIETKLVGEAFDHRVFHKREFIGYPLMNCHVDYFRLSRCQTSSGRASTCSWTCFNTNTGNIGLSLSYLKASIAAKNKKAPDYENWGNATEKWLLIVCGAGFVSSQAASINRRLKPDSQLKTLCRRSPYDRIVVFDRVHNWHRWLKGRLSISH